MRYRSAQGGAVEDGDVPQRRPRRLAMNSELDTTGHHAGTHIDALCHISAGPDAHWYGGYTAAEHAGDFGAPTTTRARCLRSSPAASCSTSRAPRRRRTGQRIAVDAAEVDAVMAAQGTEVRAGDVVLVRTGYMSYWPHDLEGAGHRSSTPPV